MTLHVPDHRSAAHDIHHVDVRYRVVAGNDFQPMRLDVQYLQRSPSAQTTRQGERRSGSGGEDHQVIFVGPLDVAKLSVTDNRGRNWIEESHAGQTADNTERHNQRRCRIRTRVPCEVSICIW